MADVHPRMRLDDNFASAIRFSLMVALGNGAEAEFGALADILQASDSAVSKAIAHLQAIGYVTVRKGYVGRRPRTWVSTTARGGQALEAHLQALRDIVGAGGASL